MGEIMSRMSQVLHEMTGAAGSGMHMDYHLRIEGMKTERDPYDTSAKMSATR